MTTVQERHWEDFQIGQVFRSGSACITADQIKSFGAEFDPQPFHLDEATASTTIFRGLAASGWHTAAITMRLLVQSDFRPVGGIVGASFEGKWPTPVRPDDELRLTAEVIGVRRSASKPMLGLVTVKAATVNQHGGSVQLSTFTLVVPCRQEA